MTGDSNYKKLQVVDVDAAVVGISRRRWTSLPVAHASPASASLVMREGRFDVLPVEADGVLTYYTTKQWGVFDEVHECELDKRHCLPQCTPIREVIEHFAASESPNFFFLTGQNDSVTGLITVSNLNCSQARIYAFGLFVELEVTLSNFIQHELSRKEISETALFRHVPNEAVGGLVKDRVDGMDRNLVEYLSLSGLINILGKERLFEPLGFPSRSKFDDEYGRLSKIRNLLAHPVRTLVERPEDVATLWRSILVAETALNSLSTHRPWGAL